MRESHLTRSVAGLIRDVRGPAARVSDAGVIVPGIRGGDGDLVPS